VKDQLSDMVEEKRELGEGAALHKEAQTWILFQRLQERRPRVLETKARRRGKWSFLLGSSIFFSHFSFFHR
jgi:hypothetical protein